MRLLANILTVFTFFYLGMASMLMMIMLHRGFAAKEAFTNGILFPFKLMGWL